MITFFKRGASSDPCETHRRLFTAKIDSGTVASKYVDDKNHAIRTVVVNENGEDYVLLFIPFDNWEDFNRITEGDKITKRASSFEFVVNNRFSFTLKFDCDYN